jgi:hypothetical protein
MEMKLPNKVKIVEVGPRDGLQNEKEAYPPPSRSNWSTACRAPVFQCRSGVLRVAEMGAADGDQRRSHGRHRTPSGHHLFGADAEHAGFRSGAGEPRR